MEELAPVRALVDRGEARLLASAGDSPLRRLDRIARRRVLAVAAFRELRKLRREVEAGREDGEPYIEGV